MKTRHKQKALRPRILLLFKRERVEDFATLDGTPCALVPFRSAPDRHVGRNELLSDTERAALLQEFVLSDGIPMTFRNPRGQEFFAIPDALQQANAA